MRNFFEEKHFISVRVFIRYIFMGLEIEKVKGKTDLLPAGLEARKIPQKGKMTALKTHQ